MTDQELLTQLERIDAVPVAYGRAYDLAKPFQREKTLLLSFAKEDDWNVPVYLRPATPSDTVLRSDFDLKANEVEKAKALITRIYHTLAEDHPTRRIIENSTGSWFMNGINRDANDTPN